MEVETMEVDTMDVSDVSRRWLYLAAGWTALALGFVGIFLPVLPTTPLVLLAAWLFARSSERMHRWLLEHRRFGPLISDWEEEGVIRLRAKILATVMIVPLVAVMLFATGAPAWTKILASSLVLGGLTFIWTKPSRRPPRRQKPENPDPIIREAR